MASSIKTMDSTNFHLPDECWEHVFKFLDDDDYHRHLKSISLVSKQFLSITNHLRLSLTICDQTYPFLHRLFHRFPNFTSLDLSCYCFFDIHKLLRRISRSPLKLTSLDLSNQPTIPFKALQAFSEKITTLTSLTCSNIDSLGNNDMVLISHCFPFLEQLDLSSSSSFSSRDFDIMNVGVISMSMSLPKLHKVNLSGQFYLNDSSLLHLCKNCEFLEEVIMLKCPFLTQEGIASVIRERPTLKSLSIRWRSNGRLDDISSHILDSLVSLRGLTCLDLSSLHISDKLLSSLAMGGLPLRRLVLQNSTGYSYHGLFQLLSKCQCIQHMDLQKAEFLNDHHLVKLSLFLGGLVSLNVNKCRMLTGSSLFALVIKCPSLNEIKMEYTSTGKESVENSNSFIDVSISPQLKSLYLLAIHT